MRAYLVVETEVLAPGLRRSHVEQVRAVVDPLALPGLDAPPAGRG